MPRPLSNLLYALLDLLPDQDSYLLTDIIISNFAFDLPYNSDRPSDDPHPTLINFALSIIRLIVASFRLLGSETYKASDGPFASLIPASSILSSHSSSDPSPQGYIIIPFLFLRDLIDAIVITHLLLLQSI